VARSALPGVQRAIYTRLAADAASDAPGSLKTLGVTGVHDYVPEQREFPYITVLDATEIPRNTQDGYGREVTATVHVWSKYRGNSEGLTIEARVTELFDHRPLGVEGHHVVFVRLQQAQPLRDPDPLIRHVPIRFRIVTEQKD
jgi:hypothetical protein